MYLLDEKYWNSPCLWSLLDLANRPESWIQQNNQVGQIVMYRFLEEKKSASGTVNYAMRTDYQLKLKLPRIINGDDKLHGK